MSARLYLLGRFRLEVGAQAVGLRTRKTESLLAFLALHPQAHTREQLAAMLWGEASQEAARVSLRQELAALRRALGAAALLSDRLSVQLNPDYPLWVDALALRERLAAPDLGADELESALALYAGELLPHLYEAWALFERQRLQQQQREALLRLVQLRRSQGDYARAIQLAQQALASDPADEYAHQHLMACYMASGDRSAALRQYERCRGELQAHLGVEPSPETQALQRHIQKAHAGGQGGAAQLTNLPVPTTSFVGRLEALEAIESLLQPLARRARGVRLLTLSGAGGSGKTRLAIQAGRELLDAYPDGVWWVELGALSDPGRVAQCVAAVVGAGDPEAGEAPPHSLRASLLRRLRALQALLVLDNCEHLLEACAELAGEVLQACPGVQLLVTSREPLRLPGETVWAVPPLSLPAGPVGEPERLLEAESLRLFVERAQAVRPDFRLARENAGEVVEICQRLDGLPLAIELAAARLRLLTPAQISARLEDRFGLLVSAGRGAQPRQQTLRALVDWSHNLLAPAEQVLFRRLAVFAGGWSLEAAEAICAAPFPGEGAARLESYQILDLLGALVDKSLVAVQERGRAMRYTYLETLRAYARERLAEAGELEWLHARHLDYYLALAESGEQETGAWLERLGDDPENLRQALEWGIGHDPPRSLQLAGAVWPFWELGGHSAEGKTWLEQALHASGEAGPAAHPARALSRAGTLAWQQGDHQRAAVLHRSALALYRQSGDRLGVSSSLNNLAAQRLAQGDYAGAEELCQEGLRVARQAGDEQVLSAVLNNLGIIHMETGRYAGAAAFLQEALEVNRRAGSLLRGAIARHNLGEVARLQGGPEQMEQALAHYTLSLDECRQAGYPLGAAMNLWGLGAVHYLRGDYPAAVERLAASLRLALEMGAQDWAARCLAWLGLALAQAGPGELAARLLAAGEPLASAAIPVEQAERAVAKLRAELGAEAFERAGQAGRASEVGQLAGEVEAMLSKLL